MYYIEKKEKVRHRKVDNVKSNADSGDKLVDSDWLLIIITLFLLIFPSWVRGGADRESLAAFPQIAVFAFFLFLVSPYLRRTSNSHGITLAREQMRYILRDPFFYLGGALLCQLVIQWLLGGNEPFIPGSTHIDSVPPATERITRWDMLILFVPVFTAVMVLRHGFCKRRMVMIVMWSMIINASLIAILGLLNLFVFKNVPTWLASILPQHETFSFAIFSYPNHGGSYFILHLGLACGLFFYYFSTRKPGCPFPRSPGKSKLTKQKALLSVIILLMFSAAIMTQTRFAILFAPLLALCFIGQILYTIIKQKRYISLVRGLMVFFVLTGIICSFFLLKSHKSIRFELLSMSQPGKLIKQELKARLWAVEAAVGIWTDHTLFGVGGGSFHKYIDQYAKIPKRTYICLYHVHNDLFQFLCEFGIFGLGMILGGFVVLAAGIFSSKKWKTSFILYGLLGAAGVMIQSLIDLPFRSPPVLAAFMVILSGFGALCQLRE